MADDRPISRAPRLSLLFRGAGTRFALPATAILEVAPAPSDRRLVSTHNGLTIEDFSQLLGEPAPVPPTAVTLVLDCAPPRALLVSAVEEVADLTSAAYFRLPGVVPGDLQRLIRGAVLHKGKLALELVPEHLADYAPGLGIRPRPPAPKLAEATTPPPDRALVFTAGWGTKYAVPLSIATKIAKLEGLCQIPKLPPGYLGLMHHEGMLVQVFDLSLLRGLPPTPPDLVAVMDVQGEPVGIAASAVLGVMTDFAPEPEVHAGGVVFRAKDGSEVFFPDVAQWVGSGRAESS